MVASWIFNNDFTDFRGLHALKVFPNVPLVWVSVNKLFELFQECGSDAILMPPVWSADILDFRSVMAFPFPPHIPEHDGASRSFLQDCRCSIKAKEGPKDLNGFFWIGSPALNLVALGDQDFSLSERRQGQKKTARFIGIDDRGPHTVRSLFAFLFEPRGLEFGNDRNRISKER